MLSFLAVVILIRIKNLEDFAYSNQLFNATLGREFPSGSTVNLTECSFVDVRTSLEGSALFLSHVSIISILQCSFTNLSALRGGIYVTSSQSLMIQGSVLSECYAQTDCGGIYASNISRGTLTNVTFVTLLPLVREVASIYYWWRYSQSMHVSFHIVMRNREDLFMYQQPT
jgi:hypothetical protein